MRDIALKTAFQDDSGTPIGPGFGLNKVLGKCDTPIDAFRFNGGSGSIMKDANHCGTLDISVAEVLSRITEQGPRALFEYLKRKVEITNAQPLIVLSIHLPEKTDAIPEKLFDLQRKLATDSTVLLLGDFNCEAVAHQSSTNRDIEVLLPSGFPTTIGMQSVDNLLLLAHDWTSMKSKTASVAQFETMSSRSWWGSHGNWLSDHFLVVASLINTKMWK